MTYGVLGLGSIGARHAANLLALGQQVVAFDPSADVRQHSQSNGLSVTDSRDDVLEKSKAVIIASPNACHLQDMHDAIQAECHVFVEKPLAHTDDGLDNILDQADRKSMSVFVGFNFRFHPIVRDVRDILAGKSLGKILWARFQGSSYLPDWRPGRDYREGYAADPASGGVMFDLVHEFDLAFHFLGPAKTQAAVAHRTGLLDIPSEDCADIVLAHSEGCQSTIHLDYVTRPPLRICDIHGTHGSLHLDFLGRCYRHLDEAGETVEERAFYTTFDDDYISEMKAFLECAEGRAKPLCDGREALSVLRQLLAARRMSGLPCA